jgi:uncharacterized protein YdhG (YjbR/CyaY superfamily)
MTVARKRSAVDKYFDRQPPDTKKTLLALRAIIMKTVPEATELINYDVPAYALVKDGKRDKQIMIAGYKTFVGFYTGTGILEHFSQALTGCIIGKASIQFSNSQPLPKKLIVDIIRFKRKRSLSELSAPPRRIS